MGSNTAKKQRSKGKPFIKGDPRINRNGRPRSFDFIRELAQQIGDEVDPNIKKTNAEIVLRRLMKDDGDKFIEVAYGKTPQTLNLEVDQKPKTIIIRESKPTDGK
jgi:hypothetical protein